MFHFTEFKKLKYVHHTVDTYLGIQCVTTLNSEKSDLVITHSLIVMAIMIISAQIKTDNRPAHVSKKIKQVLLIIIQSILQVYQTNPTCQTVIERSNKGYVRQTEWDGK